jgi:hypothetical protein
VGTKSDALNGAPIDSGSLNDWVVAFESSVGLGINGAPVPGQPNLPCTGSLITPDHVLTAAHCLYPETGADPNNPVPAVPQSFEVRFGAHFYAPNALTVTASAANIVVHPKAISSGFATPYDVASFKLDRRVGVNTTEQQIVPRRPRLSNLPTPSTGVLVRSIGFGLSPGNSCTLASFPAGATIGDRRSTLFDVNYDNSLGRWLGQADATDQHTTGGDSGGPIVDVASGDIIGVEHSSSGTSVCTMQWAATVDSPASSWILQTMLADFDTGQWLGENDPAGAGVDGDYVSQKNGDDNCPLDYNPDQSDRDSDGIGDVCDSCPDDSDDTSQLDSNFDAELANYGDLVGDNGFVPPGQDDPAFLKNRESHYLGDACEPKLPIVRHGLQAAPFPCPPFPGNCSVSTWNSQVSYDAVVSPNQANYDYGFRFCRCDPSLDTSTVEGRKLCRTVGNCSFKIQENSYFDDTNTQSPWLPITVDNQKGGTFNDVYFTKVSSGAQQKTWDFRQDLSALVHPPAPGSKTDFSTHGILMSHTEPHTTQFGTLTSLSNYTGPAIDIPVLFGDRSNKFADGSAKISVHFGPAPGLTIPSGADFGPGPPFVYCPACPIFDKTPFLTLGDAVYTGVFAVTGSQQVQINDRFDAAALDLLRSTSGKLLHATEPLGVLRKFQPEWTTVLMTPDLQVGGLLRGDSAGLHQVRVSPPAPRSAASAIAGPSLLPGSALVAMATRGRILLAGGVDEAGLPSDSLWLFDVASGNWHRREILSDVRPGKILASTFRFSDGAVYALEEAPADEPKHTKGRFLRIRTNGTVDILGTWPRLGKASVALSVSEDDDLLVGLSNAGAHAVIVVAIDAHGALDPRAWNIGPGSLVAAPRLTTTWLTTVVKQGQHQHVREVQRRDLFPAWGFLGEGWW